MPSVGLGIERLADDVVPDLLLLAGVVPCFFCVVVLPVAGWLMMPCAFAMVIHNNNNKVVNVRFIYVVIFYVSTKLDIIMNKSIQKEENNVLKFRISLRLSRRLRTLP